MDKNEKETGLALLPAMTGIELYSNGSARSVLDKIKAEVRSTVIDATTDKGRKEIASLAHKVSKAKVAMDEMGKSLTEEQRELINRVNEERRIIREELDSLRDEVRKPLTDYENREKERVAGHESRIANFIAATSNVSELDSVALSKLIEKAEAFDTSGMEEFASNAETHKGAALFKLGKLRDETLAAEQEKARIESERIEAEEKARKEREERIAKEAAEKARLEAEEIAAAEKQESEARRLHEIAQIEAAAQAREKALRDEAELMERIAKEAAEKLRRDQAKAELDRLNAIEAERIADEKRAANKKHRATILGSALQALVDAGVNANEAVKALDAIEAGKVPAVSIQF
jgi:colicin import membrane protein